MDRILSTLTHLDYLRAEGRDVALSPRLMEFGNAYLAASGTRDALEPPAVRLADELDESVSVAVPDRDGARFVSQTARRRTMSLAFRIGDLLPAERCAPGALSAGQWSAAERAGFAARLRRDPDGATFPAVPPRRAGVAQVAETIETQFDDRVERAAERGWALDDQLIEPGLIAIAVPVRAATTGRIVAAVSVVSHTSRHTAASLEAHALHALRKTAKEMEASLAAGATALEPLPSASESSGFDDPKRELGPQFLRSLARGLAVLSALGGQAGGMTLSAVAEATGLPRATARRALITLRDEGYAVSDGRLFAPAPRVLELGYARLSALSVEELVRPHLARLAARVHESASVAVLSGPDIRYVARMATHRIMQVSITVGTRFPAYATSMGRVLLAALPESEQAARIAVTDLKPLTRYTVTDPEALAGILHRVAADGYALVDQELEEGLRSMAAPVRDGHGRVVAAVNVSMHAGRDDPDRARTAMLPALAEAAARIGTDLAAAGDRIAMPVE